MKLFLKKIMLLLLLHHRFFFLPGSMGVESQEGSLYMTEERWEKIRIATEPWCSFHRFHRSVCHPGKVRNPGGWRLGIDLNRKFPTGFFRDFLPSMDQQSGCLVWFILSHRLKHDEIFERQVVLKILLIYPSQTPNKMLNV